MSRLKNRRPPGQSPGAGFVSLACFLFSSALRRVRPSTLVTRSAAGARPRRVCSLRSSAGDRDLASPKSGDLDPARALRSRTPFSIRDAREQQQLQTHAGLLPPSRSRGAADARGLLPPSRTRAAADARGLLPPSRSFSPFVRLLSRRSRAPLAGRVGSRSADFGEARSRSADEGSLGRLGEAERPLRCESLGSPHASSRPMAMKPSPSLIWAPPKLVTAAGLREPDGRRLPRMYWVVFFFRSVCCRKWPSGEESLRPMVIDCPYWPPAA